MGLLNITVDTHLPSPSPLQDRRLCTLLSEPLLLREMAEELKRDPRQITRAEPPPHEETEGKKEEKHSFQNVLKWVKALMRMIPINAH